MGALRETREAIPVSPAVDAIVVGSGPGGSAVADVLTAAGWSVVIFEKGRNHLIELDDPSRLKTDYSNDELKFTVR
ncbi:MAG: NAD(P)-binding protein, partial [Acidimicrobiia bacterium]|nr:NAD(P)-binding protein [Acidimicrobiia bacterium]